jgi:cold shock CspA family protein
MWNVERGFGFIQDDAGGPRYISAHHCVARAGISPDSLKRGNRFAYEISNTRDGRTKASNVRRAYRMVELGLKAKK